MFRTKLQREAWVLKRTLAVSEWTYNCLANLVDLWGRGMEWMIFLGPNVVKRHLIRELAKQAVLIMKHGTFEEGFIRRHLTNVFEHGLVYFEVDVEADDQETFRARLDTLTLRWSSIIELKYKTNDSGYTVYLKLVGVL